MLQHYDRQGMHDIALAKIDEAIEHTPTVIDLYSAKVCDFYLFCNSLLDWSSWSGYFQLF